jgi:class 3 adenylate cyclase
MDESERKKLEQAITHLEAQRAVLGDDVVEVALAPLRQRLATLKAQESGVHQRKQVSVLFADLSGFTTMSEGMDAEDLSEMMNALWHRLDAVITTHGGRIDKHFGDGVMALWGAEAAREDDPEQAIRAALEMLAEVARFRASNEGSEVAPKRQKIALRVGIHTGPVIVGEVATTHEFTAIGDTVNLASRLEQAAPVGGVLISHDTYQHVRGLFEAEPQE